jgi:hypothetical protein
MAVEERLVEEALEAVVIDSPTSFYWFGARTGAAPQKIRRSIGGTKTRVYLKRILQGRLYRDFYCRGRATPAEDASPSRGSPRLTPFIGALSAANSGSGSCEPGWIVRGVEDGQVIVERNGLSVWVGADDIYGAPHAPRTADECAIRFPKELLGLFPGFYMALGNLGLVPGQGTTFVRFYWNLQSAGAPRLLAAATQMLNRDRIPFQFKVLSDPDLYDRCDAGVLYVEKSDYPRAADAVRRIYRDLSKHLNPLTPVFTKRLASGLALAEGPPDSTESFGASRCSILAEGIIRAWEEGVESVSARMERIAESFADAAIGLDSPFLSPGSTDDYGFAW